MTANTIRLLQNKLKNSDHGFKMVLCRTCAQHSVRVTPYIFDYFKVVHRTPSISLSALDTIWLQLKPLAPKVNIK